MLKPSAPCYSLEHNGFYSTNAVLKLGEVNAKTCATRNEAPICLSLTLNNLHSLFIICTCVWDFFWGATKAETMRPSQSHLDSVSLLASFEEGQIRAGVREGIVIGEFDDFWQLVKPAASGLFHHNPRPACLLQNLQQHNLHSFAGTEQE